jgi:YidC/Oxa1 family membrane protein insertase
MFRFLPLIILFVMSGFAAGLVIYWTFSNILSIAQQYMIMRMMGVKVEFFQGWFGREAGPSNIDKASANFLKKDGDEHEQEAFDPNKVVLEEEIEETLDDVAEGGHYQPAVTPPKPRKKKKKKT